jgi:hypothetical protein
VEDLDHKVATVEMDTVMVELLSVGEAAVEVLVAMELEVVQQETVVQEEHQKPLILLEQQLMLVQEERVVRVQQMVKHGRVEVEH